MGSILSTYYEQERWDQKTIRQKYLVNKQIEDSDKIKLKTIKADDFLFNKKKVNKKTKNAFKSKFL
jgi:hypothetical protein